jgi:phosphatidylserine/phosphatidylglycerophosphate/cardiolipin synthase-like enzyme
LKLQSTTSYILKFLYLALFVNSWLFSQIRYNPDPTSSFSGKGFVYFNGSADSHYALPGNLANDNENLEQRVIDVVNRAKKSIDLAAFELNSLNIVVALCKARERGLRVRIIFDDENAPKNNEDLWKVTRSLLQNKYKIPIMSDAGWPLIQSKKNFLKGYRAFMHNKFLVADYLTPDSTDDVVITGSYNFTITGMVSMQNIIQIQSRTLAQAYTNEFEVMWGGSDDVPDSSKATFHQYKKRPSNVQVNISKNALVKAYFAPMSKEKNRPNLLETVADLISKEADHDIKICAFSFSTDVEIDDAIREKYETKNMDVKAVFDKTGKTVYSLYSAMTMDPISRKPWSKKGEAYLAHEDRQLHHKYILIDAENPDKGDIPIVITGSFNFSKNANEVNDDNFLIIYDRSVANQYLQEFYARFNAAKKYAKDKNAPESIETETEDSD